MGQEVLERALGARGRAKDPAVGTWPSASQSVLELRPLHPGRRIPESLGVL